MSRTKCILNVLDTSILCGSSFIVHFIVLPTIDPSSKTIKVSAQAMRVVSYYGLPLEPMTADDECIEIWSKIISITILGRPSARG